MKKMYKIALIMAYIIVATFSLISLHTYNVHNASQLESDTSSITVTVPEGNISNEDMEYINAYKHIEDIDVYTSGIPIALVAQEYETTIYSKDANDYDDLKYLAGGNIKDERDIILSQSIISKYANNNENFDKYIGQEITFNIVALDANNKPLAYTNEYSFKITGIFDDSKNTDTKQIYIEEDYFYEIRSLYYNENNIIPPPPSTVTIQVKNSNFDNAMAYYNKLTNLQVTYAISPSPASAHITFFITNIIFCIVLVLVGILLKNIVKPRKKGN